MNISSEGVPVNREVFNKNFDKIFGTKKKSEEPPPTKQMEDDESEKAL